MRNEYQPKYWNQTAEDYEIYQKLTDMLVPSMGEADTDNGTLLLAISTFGYDQYNNGHCNFDNRSTRYRTMLDLIDEKDGFLTNKAQECVKDIENVIRLLDKANSASDEADDQYERCEDCDGTGMVDYGDDEDDTVCATCDGSGEVYNDYAMSEQEEIREELNDFLNQFSSSDSKMENLDELTTCIISYVAASEQLVKKTIIEETDRNLSAELLEYLKEIRITVEEFKKAQMLYAN